MRTVLDTPKVRASEEAKAELVQGAHFLCAGGTKLLENRIWGDKLDKRKILRFAIYYLAVLAIWAILSLIPWGSPIMLTQLPSPLIRFLDCFIVSFLLPIILYLSPIGSRVHSSLPWVGGIGLFSYGLFWYIGRYAEEATRVLLSRVVGSWIMTIPADLALEWLFITCFALLLRFTVSHYGFKSGVNIFILVLALVSAPPVVLEAIVSSGLVLTFNAEWVTAIGTLSASLVALVVAFLPSFLHKKRDAVRS